MPRSETNPVSVEGAYLGRLLFYDPILSRDSTFSCSSCHRQAAAFSDGPIRLSKGIDGDTLARNTPPLFNLAWYSAFFWDGRATTLEEQVWEPVRAHDEMDLDWSMATARIQQSELYAPRFKQVFGEVEIDSIYIGKAIAQFERTLLSANSRYDSVVRREIVFDSTEYRGFELVNDQSMADCLHCHTTDANALGTTGEFSNNGLEKAFTANEYADQGRAGVTRQMEHMGQFKIPSLRNVAVTAPYMHDGRFATLREVLDFYSEGVHPSFNIDAKMTESKRGGVQLTEEEKDQIITFLHTLTDHDFLNNPEFANPFPLPESQGLSGAR